MVRLILFLCAVLVLAAGLSWLADRPGSLLIAWHGYEAETSVFRAIVLLAALIGLVLLLAAAARQLWRSPGTVGTYFRRRRQQRGLEALSGGMIAIGAGDRGLATRYALQARKSLPNEPLTHLLRAQAAQLSGDRTTARRIFEAMLGSPDTEQLGLRGLFLEAQREGETEAARQFAARAVELNPKLGWSLDALFDIQCRTADWTGALDTLAIARRHGHVERPVADRRRAVILTGQAQVLEDGDPERALGLAREAHSLAPDLVPAAAVAGRLLAAKGNTARAAKTLQRAWKRSPHPDLAAAYGYARVGDSPRDRLERVRQLAALRPHASESPVALATAAIEAKDWQTARGALEPLLESRLTQRVCTLMARIEGEQHGDKGRIREWLARAVHAPRDSAWTADGVVSEHWAPVSPVTGALDAFQWRVPVESIDKVDDKALTRDLDQLLSLGAEAGAAAASAADGAQHANGSDGAGAAGGRATAAAAAAVDADVVETPRPPGPAVLPDTSDRPGRGEVARRLPPPTAPAVESERRAQTTADAAGRSPSPAEPGRWTFAMTAGPGEAGRDRAERRDQPPGAFVTPRAPDDPGPDPADAKGDLRSPLMTYGSRFRGPS